MTDGHTEMMQRQEADAKPYEGKDPYLTVIELQILGLFRQAKRRGLSSKSMRHTLNVNNAKLMDAVEQADRLDYNGKTGQVILK